MEGNALQAELSAMQDIAVALRELDEPTRARVLHWAAERFVGTEAAAVVTAPAPPYTVATVARLCPKPDPGQLLDESLSVSTLSDFFDQEPQVSKEPAIEGSGQSVTGMLNDFVVEFQDIAREWNVACSRPADECAAEPVRLVVS